MSKLKPSAAKKSQHTAYVAKGSAAKNAKRKLERHLKKYPNDLQVPLSVSDDISRASVNISLLSKPDAEPH